MVCFGLQLSNIVGIGARCTTSIRMRSRQIINSSRPVDVEMVEGCDGVRAKRHEECVDLGSPIYHNKDWSWILSIGKFKSLCSSRRER